MQMVMVSQRWILFRVLYLDGEYVCIYNPQRTLISSSRHFDETHIEQLMKVQRMIMGTRRDCNIAKLPFEDHPGAKSVRNTRRCYSLAMAVEAPRQTGAPVVSARMSRTTMELDEHQNQQKELIEVSLSFSSCQHSSPYILSPGNHLLCMCRI